MSKIISTNKLNRFWVNGIKPTIDKVKNTIKDRGSLMSNTEENKLVDALAIKEALNYQNISNKTNAQYATLEGFVTDTATDINIPHVGRCKDTSTNGWLGKAPFNYGNHWYRYVITYQNPYVSGNSASIYGNGIFWNSLGRMFNVIIEGNKDTGLTVTHQVLNVPPIKTKSDLMANTVSGLFPDALAVKEGFKEINDSLTKYNSNIHIVSDLLEEADKGANSTFIVEYDQNTANTPYSDGLTGDYRAGVALLCMTGSNYGHIIAFTSGTNQIFNRYKVLKGWSDWKEVPMIPQSINSKIVYSEKTTSTSGIIWKQGETITVQKCFKATADIVRNDVLITLPYPCHWSYLLGHYGEKSLISRIETNRQDLVLDSNITIPSGSYFFITGTAVIYQN